MISVEEALARVLELAPALGSETVPLRRAAGRVLAEAVVALRDQPPFDASAMDGYAILEADHRPGARLRVIGEAAAGNGFAGSLGPGEAVRISTGAPMPAAAGRVVIQEDVRLSDGSIELSGSLETGTNIRARGQDFRTGQRLEPGRRLRPTDVALVAAMGRAEVSVFRRPVVALITTGDELVMPDETPRDDQIIASNAFALAAMAEAEGAEVRLLPIARDDPASLGFVLGLAGDADLVVTIGGASVGPHDLVGQVAAGAGLERAFYKVAMRPGKPLMAGRLGRAAMLGLPGNPVSSIVCGHVFMLPMLRAMQGLADPQPRALAARLAVDLPANGPRTHYMRARLGPATGSGPPEIRPFERQDSALLTVLSEADALLIRPAGEAARPAGSAALYLPI